MEQDPQEITSEIFDLFDRFGHDQYGEEVTQLEHMVQSAQLAEKEGFDEEVILAAFLHDIGHLYVTSLEGPETELTDEFGAADHDSMGAEYLLKMGFSKKIATLVGGHVIAKRYLTLRRPGYFEELSDASKHTLLLQGGIMTDKEADAFEDEDLFDLMINMRRWDDQAKVPGMRMPDITYLKNMMIRHLS